MNKDVIAAVLIAFGVSAVLCPVLIPFLKKLKFGQQVRDDGPQAHLKKAGTPTMGGLAFLASVIVTSLIFVGKYPRIVPVLFLTVGFGIVGFLDDYIKIVMKRSEGLNPVQKLLGQLVITGIFCVYMIKYSGLGTVIHIPFLGIDWDMGWLYVPMLFLAVLGTDNGVNFTDGLDGLCTSVTILVATFFTVVAMGEESGIAPVTAAVVGALLGFLLFNVYPAKVFMGDTGSLALGGFVSATALMLQQPLLILLVGFIYLAEVISVMIQVTYFKKTHGKRFFRMAPIHHHFELGGWSETRVVAVFSIVTTILCLIAYLGV
ncbi:phospho-N-acetylmuramoyl-pentapeptide-transferase [Cuneatibacter sp. NSJ-177]|uniref:phospho-N-acetylmuramoyl-pentapeptide- transferase n=1 Tax=Cuneatibacter sp. NSJ-177 TaxID=2931401 RepID=UPI001FD09693|nr:phospho-N-acetylmuramoyl-pentapeptide-transferase [Cuneatibacter sp. NSJ-177]MCJ7835953.1 phospho-N-acetylmuramoyl-pentapeptide-transferase [Cuneatibacter sp. NSJ-177]